MKTPKVIITVAPTGGVGTKQQNPNLPTQPHEIAESVHRSYNEGAAICAVHVRRPDDKATCNPEIYRAANVAIRDKCDIIINNSTGGGVDGDMTGDIMPGVPEALFYERIKGVQGGCEMATFDGMSVVSVFNGENIIVDTNPTRCDELAEAFKTYGVKPEWECFNLAHVLQDATRLIEAGHDKPPYYFNLVLNTKGFQGAYPYEPKLLQLMVEHLPKGAMFCVSGIGSAQFAAAAHSIILGGHVRVGLEDNWYMRRGVLATNEQLVARLVRLVRDMGAEPATAAEAREILGLKPVKDKSLARSV